MHYPRYGFDLHKEALDLHSHRIFDSCWVEGGGVDWLYTFQQAVPAGGGGRAPVPQNQGGLL